MTQQNDIESLANTEGRYMDPNAILEVLARLSRRIQDQVDRGEEPNPDDAAELADAFVWLDGWLLQGGSLPSDWAQAIPANDDAIEDQS